MKFSKYYNPAKRKAQAKRKARINACKPYIVIVYNKLTDEMIEKAAFTTYENAKAYTEIYANNKNIGAYIQ